MGANLFTRSVTRARVKALWAGLLRVSGILFLAKRLVRRRGVIVLTFHRVLTDAELQQTASLPGMIVRRQTFEDFLKYAAEKCELLDVSAAPDWQSRGRVKLAVTFDDGWFDNASTASPIAFRHQAPMAIFIVPEKLGTALPFWPERAASSLAWSGYADAGYIERTIENLKMLPPEERNKRVGQLMAEHSASQSVTELDKTMTWEQVRELDGKDVSFGSHTTHEILTAIPLAQAEEEIAGSRERIERELGKSCRLFSYPNGDCSDEVRKLVQRAGYSFAFLNQDPGVWTQDCDPYLIPRVNVCEYHLVNAVVWNAAKGLVKEKRNKYMGKVRSQWQSWMGSPAHQQ